MTSLVLGLLTAAAGAWVFLHWPLRLPVILKAMIPLSFILGGMVAVLAGISSLKK